MANPPQLTQLAFAAGIDQSQEREVLDPAKGFAVLENGRQDKRGGYRKRLGYAALSSARFDATTRTSGNRLVVHGGKPSVIDGAVLDTYSETKALNGTASRVPEARVSVRPLSVVDVDNVFDIVLCNGYIATAALVTGPTNNIVAVSVETTEGIVVLPQGALFIGTTSAIVAALGTYGVYVILIAMDTSTANIAALSLDTTSAATIAAGWNIMTNPATDRTTTAGPASALSLQSLTDRVAFAYVNNSGGTSRVTVKTMTIAGVIDSTTVNTSSVTPDVLAIEGASADTLWISWNEALLARLRGLTPTNLSVAKATTSTLWTYLATPIRPAHVVTDASTAGAGRVLGADIDSTHVCFNARVAMFTTAAGAVVVGATPTIVGATFINRPFAFGGRYYAMAARGDLSATSLSSAVVADWTDAVASPWFRPIANPFPDLCQITTSTSRAIAHYISPSATTVALAFTVKRSAAAFIPYLVTLDFAHASRWESASHHFSTFLTGGLLSYFDGRRVAEAGFIYAPIFVVMSLTGTGITGTFSWVATYEEVDDDGNWCISSVSLPTSGSPANKTVNLNARPLAITARLSPGTNPDPRVRVAFWRTTNGGAAPYYFVGYAAHTTTGATFADNISDGNLVQNRQLLGGGNLPGTNGAPQDRRAPPYVNHVVSYNGMLIAASGADLWWSGQTVIGEGTWWNPAFSMTLEGADEITALATQDGTLFAFTKRGIYTMAGDAPSDNGSSGGLSVARKLAVDVGSVDGLTVVTELGIFFNSLRGIELLGRKGSVTWIGEEVQDTMAAYPIVTSMVLDSKSSNVRISLASITSSGQVSGPGRDIVYSLKLQAWVSVDDKTGSAAHEASQDAAMVILGGVDRYVWLGVDGTLHYEKLRTDVDAYLDGSTWIAKAAETSDFKVSGIQGNQFFNFVVSLMRWASAHDLNVSIAYNHESSFRAPTTYSAATIAALVAGWPIQQLRHYAHDDAACQAVRLRLSDATPTSGTVGTGEGATWLALTLDLVGKPGAFESPDGGA